MPEAGHDNILSAEDWTVELPTWSFGQNFEVTLRAVLEGYAEAEASAEAAGVDAKPFVARWVAESLVVRESPGWGRLVDFAAALRALVPPHSSRSVPRGRAGEAAWRSRALPGHDWARADTPRGADDAYASGNPDN